ncbi:MAG: hypothetical protein OXC42_07770 [Gammaproteobacteria bacterium]|nr:hypothetical protein [Gammaproteobacteria bacterium]
MDRELSSTEKINYFDYFDLRNGPYLKHEDWLPYFWLQDVPQDKRPNLGRPCPMDVEMLEGVNNAPPAREYMITAWIEYSKTHLQYHESLQLLMKILVDNSLSIPEPLQVWHRRMESGDKPKRPRGRPQEINATLRIYHRFIELTRDNQHSNNAAYKIIGKEASKSADTIKSSVQKHSAYMRAMACQALDSIAKKEGNSSKD